MIRLVIFFILITAISIVFAWLADNQGNVVVNWLGYRISASVTFAFFFSFLIIITAVFFIEFILFVKNAPDKIRNRIAKRKMEKGLAALTKGFAALEVADVKKSSSAAKESIKMIPNEPLAMMLAAKSAQTNDDIKSAKIFFSKLLENKDTEYMAVKGLISAAKKEGDKDTAVALAERAYKIAPDSKSVVPVMIQLYKQAGKWSEAQLLLEKISSRGFAGIFTRHNAEIQKEKAKIMMVRAMQAEREDKDELARKLIFEAVDACPGFVPAALVCADEVGDKKKAKTILEKCWKHSPHPQVAEKYLSLLSDNNAAKHLKRAIHLSKLNPNSAESHILLAKAHLLAGDPTKARNHLKIAMASGETKSLCKLMADIERAGEGEAQVIKQWQEKAAHSQSDAKWVCGECGQAYEKWDIKCSVCDATDSIEWKLPGMETIQGSTSQSPQRLILVSKQT